VSTQQTTSQLAIANRHLTFDFESLLSGCVRAISQTNTSQTLLRLPCRSPCLRSRGNNPKHLYFFSPGPVQGQQCQRLREILRVSPCVRSKPRPDSRGICGSDWVQTSPGTELGKKVRIPQWKGGFIELYSTDGFHEWFRASSPDLDGNKSIRDETSTLRRPWEVLRTTVSTLDSRLSTLDS
jgi:hypothetical protein